MDELSKTVLAQLQRRGGRRARTPPPSSLQARHHVRQVRRATPGDPPPPQIKLPAADLTDWYDRLVEMAVVQVVGFQEAFFQDYLLHLVTERPERLKSSATLTWEEVLAFDDRRALVRELSEREVDRLGRESIDGLAAYFARKLGMKVTDCPVWPAVRELNYRRNVILHDQGLATEAYCRRTGLQRPGERVLSDVAYVKRSIQAVLALMRYVHAHFERK